MRLNALAILCICTFGIGAGSFASWVVNRAKVPETGPPIYVADLAAWKTQFSDWRNRNKNIPIGPTDGIAFSQENGEPLLVISGDHTLMALDAIPIDTSKRYEVSVEVRAVSSDPTALTRLLAGFGSFDENLTPLYKGKLKYIAAAGPVYVKHGWWKRTGIIGGIGPGDNQFRLGTRYIRPMITANFRMPEMTLNIRSFTIKPLQ